MSLTLQNQDEIVLNSVDSKKTCEQLNETPYKPQQIYLASGIFKAYKNIRQAIRRTIIQRSPRLSDQYSANIFFKREDGQITRTYKARGVLNKIQNLSAEQRQQGVYSCSPGNQGVAVAYACFYLKVKGTIFVPQTTSRDKIERIKEFGKHWIELKEVGVTLTECEQIAIKHGKEFNLISIRLDDKDVIEGCGSVGIEILEDFPLKGKIDYVIFPISSGTLGAALSSYFHQLSPETQIIGVLPAFSENEMAYEGMSKLTQSDAANTFSIMNDLPNYNEFTIPEGEAYEQILQLYDDDGIILEPHGALAPASLKLLQEKHGKDSLKGKNIVCILTGINSSASKMKDIKILANVYSKKYMYLLVDFFRRADAIKEFLTICISPEDDVLQIEYTKKNNREKGPALVGIQLAKPSNYESILIKMNDLKISYKVISPQDEIFKLKV